MKKKTSKTAARRGPGRPRKTTTSKKTTGRKVGRPAKKKTRGRPRRADGILKSAAKRVQKVGKSVASAAKSTLYGTVHGLAKWVPEKGDILFTKTAGAFRLGNKSWRKDRKLVLPEAEAAQASSTPKRPRGRPRRVAVAEDLAVIPIKTSRSRKVSPVIEAETEELTGRVRQVVEGSSEKRA